MFTLSGLSGTNNYRVILFALTLLCYCVIWLVNLTIIVTIIVDKKLHEPMYIFLCNLCINGLYGTAGFYPKFLKDLLSTTHVISYAGCLLQGFVMYSFACSELSILAVMAYDRYLAICRPLHYHFVMTKRRLSQLICFSWLTPFSLFSISVLLTDLPQSIQNFIAIEFLLISPVLNPLIYGFKLTKIRNRILGFVHFDKK
ncbi:olfactory receptor 4P4-like [Lycodopsis pacificus]